MQVREQPADWTEAGAHVVINGVYRIPLPLEIVGLHAVNVYALVDGNDLTVIDSGWSSPSTRAALDAALGVVTREVVTARLLEAGRTS
jgi:hypothetical protein